MTETATPPAFPQTFPQTFTQLDHAMTVVGIELRTSNLNALDTIPPHWARFNHEGVLAQIPQRQSDTVFAVYTHFENAGLNNTGLYSLVIGATVPAHAAVPVGMVRVVVPASKRVEFAVPARRFDLVGPAWQAVWAQTSLPKTFVAEYERYSANGDIAISIGLSSGA